MAKRYLVTSALPYVNNIPHLGNLICILSADIYTRHLRQRGEDVRSVLGTDEHGTTTEIIAKQKNVSPKRLVEIYREKHKEIYDWFNCDFDYFGTTTSKENTEYTQHFYEALEANGYIQEKKEQQLYDEEAEQFLADRYVEGTCPVCGAEDARGDQCDHCGKLLEPTELINPKSTLSGTKPVKKRTKNLYLDLEALQPLLEEHYEEHSEKWTKTARTETKSWLKKGLKPRAITRDLSWGIPVPREGYKHKVFYVWFDAPIGYISITAEHTDIKKWWKDQDTEIVQFMGKDNIPFHTIMFPATLLGANEDWNVPRIIETNEYLNYEDQQFSKSRGVGVFGHHAKQTGIPADVWRYYVARKRPEQADTAFTWDDLQSKNNAELAGNIGNLTQRVLAFITRHRDGAIHSHEDLLVDYEDTTKNILEYYENRKIKHATEHIQRLSTTANTFFQDEAPWNSEDDEHIDHVLHTLATMIRDIAVLLAPIMPRTSQHIQTELLNQDQTASYEALGNPVGTTEIPEPETLFDQIQDDELSELQEKFSGKKNTAPELRVGKIEEIKLHSNADKLFVEQVHFGDHTRQIVSRLVPYYDADELLGKKVLVVTNLKTAKLRGEQSEGMLLAVDGEDKQVGVITMEDYDVGETITFPHTNPADEITFQEFQKKGFELKEGLIYLDSEKMMQTRRVEADHGLDGAIR